MKFVKICDFGFPPAHFKLIDLNGTFPFHVN